MYKQKFKEREKEYDKQVSEKGSIIRCGLCSCCYTVAATVFAGENAETDEAAWKIQGEGRKCSLGA